MPREFLAERKLVFTFHKLALVKNILNDLNSKNRLVIPHHCSTNWASPLFAFLTNMMAVRTGVHWADSGDFKANWALDMFSQILEQRLLPRPLHVVHGKLYGILKHKQYNAIA